MRSRVPPHRLSTELNNGDFEVKVHYLTKKNVMPVNSPCDHKYGGESMSLILILKFQPVTNRGQ